MSIQYKVPSLMALMLTVSSSAALAGQKDSTVAPHDFAPSKISKSFFDMPKSSTGKTKMSGSDKNEGQVCGTDKNKQDWDALQVENQLQLKKKLAKAMMNLAPKAKAAPAAVNGNGVAGRYYIPVVVHVYGDQYNCTDESAYCLTENKIIQGLNMTNEDFLGTNTQDGPIAVEFAAIRENLNIEFVLAKKDPQGNATNGIVRYANKAGYGNGTGADAQIAADAWDNFKYMNIYFQSDLYDDGTTSSSGVAWYPEMGMSEAGLSRVVYNGNFVGVNTGENFRSVLTHEFGHWLNLPHTFDGDTCSVHQETFCGLTGDNNCDTPQIVSSSIQDNAPNCLGESTNTENFMHYSDNYAMYTQGQVQRMTAALHGDARSSLWTNSNLIAAGLDEYTSNSGHIWDGSGTDEVPTGELIKEFTNLSATKGETTTFEVNLPEGTQAAVVYLKGFTQDPDMYVSKGKAPVKTGDVWEADYISFKSTGTPELVALSSPSATQTYYVTVDAFTDYSNATLEILSVVDTTLCDGCERVFLAEETNLTATKGDADKTYQFEVPSDALRTVVVIPGGYTGDPDMYVSVNSVPTTDLADCAPFSAPGINEFCDLGAGGGTVNVLMEAFLDYGGATFRVYYERQATLVVGLPTAEANGAYNSVVGEAVSFSSAGSVDSNGSIDTYAWTFGDNGTSNVANPVHTYSAAGNFTATLTVTDNEGNTATDSSLVNVTAQNEVPTAVINGPYSTDENQEITFSSNGSFDNDGTIVSYLWTFGDGATSTLATPSHTYLTAGDYPVELTVTDNDQASSSVSTTVTIKEVVVVTEYCAVTGNTGYEWIANVSAGGQSHSSEKEGYADNTSVNFPLTVGNNTVTLTAGGNYSEHWAAWLDVNKNGEFEASEKLLSNVSGKGAVSGQLSIPNGLVGLNTRLRVVMKYSNAPNTACGSLGDGEAEDYMVTVVGTDNVAPVADANGDYAASINDSVNFISMGSQDTDGDIISTLWDFGDNNQSSDANPSHVYSTAGSYTASLTVTDNDGASHTDTALVTINPVDVSIENACLTKSAITGGSLTVGIAECLGSSSTIWFSLGDVSSHQTIAISTGHGEGTLDVLYKNGGWPSDTSNDGQSSGNGSTTTCLSLAAGSNYWSYLKVTGGAIGATILVEFDSASCQ